MEARRAVCQIAAVCRHANKFYLKNINAKIEFVNDGMRQYQFLSLHIMQARAEVCKSEIIVVYV